MSLIPKCSFRIIGLSEDELSNIVDNYLHGISYRTGSNYKDRSQKVLRLVVDDSTDSATLQCLVKEKPGHAIHDFFISISSNQQSAVVDIPDFLLSLQNKVGGSICFSYTCTFDPDE